MIWLVMIHVNLLVSEKLTNQQFLDGNDKPIGVEIDIEIKMDISTRQKMNKSTNNAKSTDSSIVLDPRVNRSYDERNADKYHKPAFS